MNNDEISLTPEQKQTLDLKKRELERKEDINKELIEEREKIKEEDYQIRKDRLEREIKQIDEEIENAERINAEIENRMKNYFSLTGSGAPADLRKIRYRGNQQAVRLSSMGGLVEQFCVYFSFYDCPFADDAKPGSPTAAEEASKDELIKSITGRTTRQLDTANSATANSGISNWELEAPRSGIVEPTPYSYEWYKRWWKFFRNYSRTNIFFGTVEEMEKGTTIANIYAAKARAIFPIKDAHVLIRDAYGSDENKYLQRAREYYINTNRKERVLRTTIPAQNYPSGIGTNVNLNFSIVDLWSNFAFFWSSVFPRNTKIDNLLINDKVAPSGKKYVLGPEDIRKAKFDVLAVNYWTPKDPNKQTLMIDDYDWHSVPRLVYNTEKKLMCDPNDMLIFSDIASGIDGPIEVFHEAIVDSNVFNELCDSAGLEKILPNDARKKSQYFINRKADLIFQPGDLPGTLIDVEKKLKEKADKQKELEDIDVNYYEGKRKNLDAEIRLNNKRIAELKREIEALSGSSEKNLRRRVIRQAKQVKELLSSGSRKQTLEWFQDFKNNVDQLNEMVRDRLKDESQNINADKSKKLEEGSKEYNEFDIRIPDKSDKYFKSNDETKKALTNEGIREAWKEYNEKIWQKVKDPVSRLSALFFNNNLTHDKKQFENWLKDKNNAKVANDMLKEINKLQEVVILNEFYEWAVEKIRDSKIFAKDLEATLREILGSKYKSTIGNAWRKMGYGEGNAFHELITYKTNLHNNDKFKTWLNGDAKGGPKYSKTFVDWLVEKSLSDDPKNDILAYILRYRLNEYIEENSDGRKGYKKEIVLGWINKLTREIRAFTIEDFDNVTGGDGKKGNEVLKSFLRSFARPYGDVMNLDPDKSSENRTIEKWMNANYKVETVKSLKEGMDEEFMKDKDPKGIWDTDPKKLHKEVREHQINKEGVTKENYKEFKEKDKEKLEKTLSYLNDLIEHKLATEEQVEFHKQLSSHIAALTTAGGKKPEGEEGGKKPEGEEGGKKPEGEEGGKKPEGETKKPTEDKKWFQKGGYAVFWAPILAILLIGGLGYALGWWGGKKEEAEEETTTETEEGEK